jgi:hypothetical protein
MNDMAEPATDVIVDGARQPISAEHVYRTEENIVLFRIITY